MAKARKAQIEVSLFPFLSILACVIGILVLVLCTVIISQIDPEGMAEVKEANEENLKKQKQLDALEVQRLALQKELDRVNDLQTQKINFKSKIAKLKQEIAKAKKDQAALLSKNSKVKAASAELKLKLKQKADVLASLQEKEKLHSLLTAALNKEKERLHSKLKIQATGSGFLANTLPTYIECNDKGITIIGDNPREIPRSKVGGDKQFLALLKTNSNNAKKIIVLLVRPSYPSISNYNMMSGLCAKNGARTSKIPLISNDPLSVGGR